MKSQLIRLKFKENRRAVWSLRILAVFIIVSILAPLIANEKPIVVCLSDRCYYPIVSFILRKTSEVTFLQK